MSNRNLRERLKWFNSFAKNLSIVNPNYSGVFVCPFCYKIFTEDAVHTELSLAHIWPESLGGRLKTLACKSCNSFMGSEIESHLKNYIQNPYRERLFPNEDSNESLGIKINLEGINTISIKVVPENSNTKILDWRVQEGKPFKIQMLETFRRDRVNLTYLHFAYLYLFHCFGYEWIATPFAQRVCQQLKNPNEQTFQTYLSEIAVENLPNHQLLQDKIPYGFVIAKPRERIGFAVSSPVLENLPNHRILVLFFLSNPDIHLQNNIDKTLDEIALDPALDLHKVHELISSTDAPHLSRKIIFTSLLNSGIVQSKEEAHELVKRAYFPSKQ